MNGNAEERHQLVLEQLAERGLGREHYLDVWREQNLSAPRDLPEPGRTIFNDRAWELEHLLGLEVPDQSAINHEAAKE